MNFKNTNYKYNLNFKVKIINNHLKKHIMFFEQFSKQYNNGH